MQMEIAYRPAIADDITGKPPLVAKNLLQQILAAGTRLAINRIVSGHNRLSVRFDNTILKRSQISLVKIPFAYLCVKLMPQILRAAVNRKMLRCCYKLEVLRVVALNSLDELYAKSAGQVGVFAISLMASAPTGIAENVNVRRSEAGDPKN